MKFLLLLFSLCTVFSTVVPLHAALPGPPALPTGVVYNRAGEAAMLEKIGAEKGVVLLLLNNVTRGGEQLLTFMTALKTPVPADRLLVVVRGINNTLLNSLAARHAALAASWYRDPDDLIAKGLELKADPAILGIRDGRVSWMMIGIADRKLLDNTVQGWLSR